MRFSGMLPLVSVVLSSIVCQAMPTDHHHHHHHPRHYHARNASLIHSLPENGVPVRLAKRIQQENNCEQPHRSMFTLAFDDAREALGRMISRSEDLKDYLKSYPTELPADDHVLSALYTFQAIFRAVNFADIHELHDAEEDIDGLISTAESLRTALENTNPPIWELYCRDTDWLHHIQGYSYWDDRPAERGGQKTMDLTSIEGSCDDNKNLVAFMTFDARNNPAVPVEAITFCSKSLDGFTTETLQEMQRQSFATGNMHIEQVALDKMSLSLIHEMSHSRAVLGSTDAYIDATYENDNGDKETAYGWKAITTLRRQSTKDALDNADSFAYYVAAMYLDNNDWASGFAYTFEDLRQAVSAPQEGEGSDSGDDSDGSDY